MPRLTKEQRYFEALDTIAQYVIPSHPINGKDYVETETVVYLRQVARDALKNK